jgi:hypothetical protein
MAHAFQLVYGWNLTRSVLHVKLAEVHDVLRDHTAGPPYFLVFREAIQSR